VAAEISPVSVEYLPAEHCVHSSVPLLVLNVPAMHATHVPPSGPVYPMLHLQPVTVLPLTEFECAGQLVQLLDPVCSPVTSVAVRARNPYVPAGQALHA
jgi:hypothetical protein